MLHLVDWARQIRREKKISQKELGRRLGISRGGINRWENGKTKLKTVDLERILKAMGQEVLIIPKREN